MTDTSDTEFKRAELIRELWTIGHTIGMPIAKHQEWRNRRMAEIQAALEALPKPTQQPIGMAAGSVVVGADRLLGSVPPPDSGPAPDIGHQSTSLGDSAHPWMPGE